MPRRRSQRTAPTRPSTTREKVHVYKTVKPLLEAMLLDIKELAKKKPDSTLTKANVTRINRLLVDLRECLKDEETIKYLDQLEDDILPQYSDALVVMSQYKAALEAFYDRYWDRGDLLEDDGDWSTTQS